MRHARNQINAKEPLDSPQRASTAAGHPAVRPRQQRGAVLLVVTFSLIVLFGLAALVLDVSRMYIIKSQLQNAADAGALRAAKVLDGTLPGLATAESKAREAARNNGLLMAANPLADSDIQVQFATTPFPADWSAADAACRSNAYSCLFARVDTSAANISSFFAGIIGVESNAARALAVAGRFTVDVMPLAVCAIDLDKCPPSNQACGYVKGLSYKISEINPIGPGTLYWLDPMATTPSCTITSSNETRPFVCQGKVSAQLLTSPTVYTNTGISSGPLLAAMDSRFGDYDPQGQCSPDTAPPDTNVMQYLCQSGGNCPIASNTPSVTANWADPIASRQAAQRTSPAGVMPMIINNEGVVWSASRPETAAISGRSANASYPVAGTPYTQITQGPAGPGATFAFPERRLINMIIVECQTAGGVCRPAPVKGVGKFFLTRKTNISSDKEIYAEFVRMLTTAELNSEIKLYR